MRQAGHPVTAKVQRGQQLVLAQSVGDGRDLVLRHQQVLQRGDPVQGLG